MTIQRADVIIDVQGEQQAVAEANRVGREMDAVTRKATQAEAAANSAIGLRGRLDSLLLRAKQNGILKRGGIEYGAIELNQGGFGLNRGWLRGSGTGTGAALLGVGLMHGVGAGLNQVADIRDYIKQLVHQELTAAQVFDRVSTKAVESIFEGLGATSVLRGILRLGGENPDVIEQALRDLFATPEEQRAEARAARAASRQRAQMHAQIQKAQADTLADIEAKRREALSAVDAVTDRELAGVKNETLPVGLPRAMARAFAARRKAEIANKGAAARRGIEAAAKERRLQVGEGD